MWTPTELIRLSIAIENRVDAHGDLLPRAGVIQYAVVTTYGVRARG